MRFGPLLSRLVFAALAIFVLVCAGACREPSARLGSLDAEAPAATLAPSGNPPAQAPVGTTLVDWLKPTPACSFGHRGALVDFGDSALARVRVRGGKGSASKPEATTVEHEGASWLRVTGRELSVPFAAPFDIPADTPTVVELRGRAGAARSVTVLVNGKVAGVGAFAKQGVKVITLKASSNLIVPGENELQLRFSNAGKGPDAAADIDWVRVGALDNETSYAAPTRTDAIATVTVAKTQRRAIQLRANSYVRCSSFLPEGTRFTMQLGLVGEGEGDAEVRVLRDGAAPVVLGAYHVVAGEAFRAIDVALPAGAGFSEVAVVVSKVSKGSRVALGEPRLVGMDVGAPPEAPLPTAINSTKADAGDIRAPSARGVVLVVLGSLPVSGISVYGGTTETPELGALAATGLVFDDHRAVTSIASGNMATILTGLPATGHGITSTLAKLPAQLTTLAGCAKQGGVSAAMFTANPTTSAAYGFDRDWNAFRYLDPTDAAPATRIFDDAAEWLQKHSNDRFLLVIHARAGHPPWDALREELKEMPPQSYSGSMDPKMAGDFLFRVHKSKNARFTDADRTRLWALHALAVRAHDAALGRFLNTLRSTHRDEDTAILVTSDVGVDTAAHVPFVEGETLDEATLRLALVLRPPASQPEAAARLTTPSSPEDVARTILHALGLKPPDVFGGVDLWALARSGKDMKGRLRTASTGERYAHAWGNFVLAGGSYSTALPRLCDRSKDSPCATDLRLSAPITFATFAARADELKANTTRRPQETISMDFALSTALKVWGRAGE
ncbi:MAG: sulfatase-like hydrolase/transferase [Polyangiaceae bacterium]